MIGAIAGLLACSAIWTADNADIPAGYTGCIDICGDQDLVPIADASAMAQAHPGQTYDTNPTDH